MKTELAPNQKGERILRALHIVIALVVLAYTAMGIFGICAMWSIQPNVFGKITAVVAFAFTTLGLYYILSWIASWTLGWFPAGMIQSGVWRNIRDAVAEAIALLVGVSCITSAITWIIER
jgi:hypothetical protein